MIIFDDCLLENHDDMKDYFITEDIQIFFKYTWASVILYLKVFTNNLKMLVMFRKNEHCTKLIYEFIGSEMRNWKFFTDM